MKFVCDDDHRFIIRFHISDHFEKTLRLLWCQYCRRLVQNQNVSTPVQYLNDFQSLLLRNTHLVNLLIQVQVKMISVADCLCFFLNLFQVKLFFFIKTESNVFHSGKNINQFEMLVDHADSEIIGVFWRTNLYSFPIYKYFSCIREIDARNHIHQGGFTASVFAQKRKDFSFSHI